MAILEEDSMFEAAMATDPSITEKQKAILRASLDLFAEKGFDKTSTSDIAQRAGVAEGTVYRRYHDKAALRQAVIAPLIGKVVPSMAEDFLTNEMNSDYAQLNDFLNTIMTERFNFVLTNLKELKILFEVLLFSEDIRQQLIKILGPKVTTDVFQNFAMLKQRKVIADMPTDIILQTMISMLLGFIGRNVLELPGAELKRQVKYTIQILSKALAPE